MTLQQNRVWPITLFFEVGFRKYFIEMITILRRRVARKFGSLPWRSRSQHDLAAKSCPAYNFVIWSQISNIFQRNIHHIETTCRAQHLGRDLEGQGHSMTFQQNSFWPITLWFEVEFTTNSQEWSSYCDNVHHLGCYLKGQGHSMTLQQNRVWPKTLLFEVGFYNYFWQTTSLCPIPFRGALPGSNRLLFWIWKHNKITIHIHTH